MNAIVFIIAGAVATALFFILAAGRLAGRKAAAVVAIPALLVAAGASYSLGGYVQKRETERQTASIVKSLETDPLYMAIRDADPIVHRRIMDVVSTSAGRADREAFVQKRTEAIMESALKTRTASMNDEMTMQTMRLQLAYLKNETRRTGACNGFFAKGQTALGQELRHGPDARRYLTALMRSAPDASPAIASPLQVRESMVALMPFILKQSGIPPEAFLTPGAKFEQNCSFMTGLMETMSTLPSERAAPLIRAMAGGQN